MQPQTTHHTSTKTPLREGESSSKSKDKSSKDDKPKKEKGAKDGDKEHKKHKDGADGKKDGGKSSKDKASGSGGGSSKKDKAAAAAPAAAPQRRVPPVMKKPPAPSGGANDYLAGIDLPSSESEEEETLAVEREDKGPMTFQASAREAKKLADKERLLMEKAHRMREEAMREDDNVFDVAFEGMGADDGATASATDVKVHSLTVRAKGKLLLENTSLTIAAGEPPFFWCRRGARVWVAGGWRWQGGGGALGKERRRAGLHACAIPRASPFLTAPPALSPTPKRNKPRIAKAAATASSAPTAAASRRCSSCWPAARSPCPATSTCCWWSRRSPARSSRRCRRSSRRTSSSCSCGARAWGRFF